MNSLRNIATWLDDRLRITALFASTAGHEVPASAGSWFYVFGSATLLCYIIQIITGACLAFVYIPSTNEAWTSLCPERVGDVKHSLADMTKAREILGYQPLISLEDGLRPTLAWYRGVMG
jgi:nucleoside-diphosphate-sugar epimerase